MIHTLRRDDAETLYLRETYRFDRSLELAVGEVCARAQLGYYGSLIPHNFRGGAWSSYIAL
jgi:hypothetical protein